MEIVKAIKTVTDAVEYHRGFWPYTTDTIYWSRAEQQFSNKPHLSGDYKVCTHDEFNEELKKRATPEDWFDYVNMVPLFNPPINTECSIKDKTGLWYFCTIVGSHEGYPIAFIKNHPTWDCSYIKLYPAFKVRPAEWNLELERKAWIAKCKAKVCICKTAAPDDTYGAIFDLMKEGWLP